MKRKPGSAPPPEDLRGRTEQALAAKGGRLKRMPEPDVQELVHNLQVHQIELGMQNDQLRQTQQALEEARDRFSDLLRFCPARAADLETVGEVLEANLAATRLLGLERTGVDPSEVQSLPARRSAGGFLPLQPSGVALRNPADERGDAPERQLAAA